MLLLRLVMPSVADRDRDRDYSTDASGFCFVGSSHATLNLLDISKLEGYRDEHNHMSRCVAKNTPAHSLNLAIYTAWRGLQLLLAP